METEKRRALTVIYSPGALKQLDDIWDWNEARYSADHADQYTEFLRRCITALAHEYESGKKVEARPDCRYISIRRKSKTHGHLAVYRVGVTQVDVIAIFHSAQD